MRILLNAKSHLSVKVMPKLHRLPSDCAAGSLNRERGAQSVGSSSNTTTGLRITFAPGMGEADMEEVDMFGMGNGNRNETGRERNGKEKGAKIDRENQNRRTR